jgi:hypothetical protein
MTPLILSLIVIFLSSVGIVGERGLVSCVNGETGICLTDCVIGGREFKTDDNVGVGAL